MSYESISSWVRQLRYRAKKHNLFNDLSIEEIHEIIGIYDNKCCACGADHETFDTCFPLKDNAPNVQANIIPLCHECKAKRKNLDLLQMMQAGLINKERLLKVLRTNFLLKHGDVFKAYVKALSGHIDN